MTRGMVLGKFLPPHAGHVYLCEFARRWVDELTIVVGTLAREPIPGELRASWMREMFPSCRVVHLNEELPQYPHEHPEFWSLWRASLTRALGGATDFVFASEDYGLRLAHELGARFVPVDPSRVAVPISGTRVREDAFAAWEHLPRCVRPYFAKRVSVLGPESTGKTTLARSLAASLGTAWVPEYARTWLEARGGDLEGLDWMDLVRGQIASEEALARECRCVLVCDTDPFVTTVWAEVLGGGCSAEVRQAALGRKYDLTLLTAPDVPWVADPVRYLPDGGHAFFARCEAALVAAGRPYVVVQGDWDSRTARALLAVRDLLAAPARPPA